MKDAKNEGWKKSNIILDSNKGKIIVIMQHILGENTRVQE